MYSALIMASPFDILASMNGFNFPFFSEIFTCTPSEYSKVSEPDKLIFLYMNFPSSV